MRYNQCMKYIAILGRQPEFGLVELENVLGADSIEPFGAQTALLAQSTNLHHLGGTQKIGRVLYHGKTGDLHDIFLAIDELPMRTSKTPFGLSFYGASVSPKYVVAAGLELKKHLKHRGSLRYVAPQGGLELTAAQIKFNNIIENGFELLVAVDKTEMIIAITEQIQDIDWYSKRDYDRPARNAKVGMLPPKLAQIMLNTTKEDMVYDPFCGTGVVLQEALLMGRCAGGSDIDQELVAATKQNLTWLRQQLPDQKLPVWTVTTADAQSVTLPSEPIAVVSEGYLGPNQSKRVDAKLVTKLKQDMEELVIKSLANWAAQIPTNTNIALTIPLWQSSSGSIGLDILDRLPDLGYTLKDFKHVDSTKLIYRRPDQFVGRQLLLLRKK